MDTVGDESNVIERDRSKTSNSNIKKLWSINIGSLERRQYLYLWSEGWTGKFCVLEQENCGFSRVMF